MQLRKRIDNILRERGVNWTNRQRELARIMSRPQEIPSIAQREFKRTVYELGVCSFGDDPRSILMWSHYSANHEEVCLQFEMARDVENLISLKVNYSEEPGVEVGWRNG